MSKLMHLDKPVLGETNIYDKATQETDGLMSKEDKVRLDNMSSVTEEDVTNWGFTKNEGTYIKPEDGIPASDLADGVIPNTDDFMSKDNPIGTGSFSIGRKNGTTVGKGSFTMGGYLTATGQYSHAEGEDCNATANWAHAEGKGCTASGEGSHAEGSYSQATKNYSHAEGNQAKGLAFAAHAEGSFTQAEANQSHAEGEETIASTESQHVQGKYNIKDTENKYAHIVGNGTVSARSNAHTIDWDGNAWFAGDVEDGSGNKLSDLTNRFTYGAEDLNEDATLADGVFYFVYEE